ncbi:cornichon-like protein [Arctopsyche grandis]|uniref:cornichon-like protein n=1 Tax=Arctopsyche grandis TaxID=121162 RepID=UPI00406D9CCB
MFLSEGVVFALALVDNGALLFLLVYHVITLSDLECDYLNAVECCSRLNGWVRWKAGAHAALVAVLALHGCWGLAGAGLPLLVWLCYEALSVPTGNLGVYEPTDIHERDRLSRHLRDVLLYLAHYLLFFFVYLYCLIVALLKGDPLQRHHDDTIITEL